MRHKLAIAILLIFTSSVLGQTRCQLEASIFGFSQNISSAKGVSSQSSNAEKPIKISVEFSVPKNFRMEQQSNSGVALMRHEKEELALFVAVPKKDQQIDDLLSDLSKGVVAQIVPGQDGFLWKIFRHSEPIMSAHQIGSGTIKGVNNRMYVQTDFVVLKAQRQEIVVGSVSVFGSEKEARYLFDVERYQYSFSGWQGLFQLIVSVTGEK